MAIQSTCKECGKTYKLKEEFVGRSFLCKSCGKPVKVEAPDEDPWDDELPDDFEEESPYAPPRQKSGKSKKGRRKRGSRDTMPPSVICATVLVGLKGLMWIAVLVINLMAVQGEPLGFHAMRAGGAVLAVGAIMAFIQRSNVMRWIVVALNSLGLFCGVCGGVFAFVSPDFQKGAGMDEATVMVLGVILMGWALLSLTIIVCLALPSANEWFDR